MILGLGTGSTVYHLIVKLAERVRGGLSIHAAATSARTEELAAHYGIPLIPFHGAQQIHLAIDGVDAIDPDFHSIKGGGGALFRDCLLYTSGDTDDIIPTKMDFCQNCNLVHQLNTPEAYERLITACMEGERSWFSQWDQIERCWNYISRLKELYSHTALPEMCIRDRL